MQYSNSRRIRIHSLMAWETRAGTTQDAPLALSQAIRALAAGEWPH